jgi:hypothetical protein
MEEEGLEGRVPPPSLLCELGKYDIRHPSYLPPHTHITITYHLPRTQSAI